MDKILEGIDKLLRTCLEFFGPGWTIFLIVLTAGGLFGYRWYTDWRKGQEINAAIKAKDETIQHLAEHNRELRVIQLKQQGWTDEMINAVVLRMTPKNAIEARELLESGSLAGPEKSKPHDPNHTSNKKRR